ncbi:asparagine synthase (glutamine-hydrolyzing) [Pedobacter sp. G11]|uniref:asparagine synthase (glutamine-hydrolyzing) n=1 Tax=Pedobacter sp. G11 TaxID=2482728 RepID=UPI000F5D5637|nr:asparagine synthase (glutamine-hydrolyzing) [Pedobacter sp. G11]AZI25859.1 asparagine synthase (glutamine-hydrolyzing) [Pedobacter sp. G11]
MCRIAGIIDHQANISQLRKEVKAMCDIMAHGGPDGEGYCSDEANGLAFGHRRLALIDLSSNGHQPMSYNSDHLTITFNGEIYNFLELKKDLVEAGFDFSSHSDTEVILAAYHHWGVASFNLLKGMFAFGLYDQLKNKTFLVRDPSGIKPLHYYNESGKLVFASEVKAFKKANILLSELPEWKVYFLAFGHIPEPYTTLAEVKMLQKGSYLCWNHESHQAEIKHYHRQNLIPYIKDFEVAKQCLRDTLKRAVKRHLISDSPIGVFLSGGIDSSLITLMADETINETSDQQTLKTLSVNFTEQEFSEQPYQKLIADQTNSNHSEYLINQSIFNQYLPVALSGMDQPTIDGINSWFVNYFAKAKGLKAVLSGIGGDELFGGYPSFKRMRMVRYLAKLPQFILKKGILFRKAALKRSYYLSYRNTTGKYLFLRGIYTPDEIAEILNLSINKIDDVLTTMTISEVPAHLSPIEEAGWLESNLYMQNQLLHDTDAMSMQHGVEVRLPFLDQDLIQLLNYTSPDIKYQLQKPKGFMVDAFMSILPEAIWNRRKMGFTFPFQRWLRRNEFFLRGISDDSPKIARLKADFINGDLHWAKAITLFLMEDLKWKA